MRAYTDAVWPALDPTKLILRLLTDSEFLATSAQGILTDEEQATISMTKPARSVAAARWTPADVILIDEVADLLNRTPSLGHVIVDEAQDLSPMQLVRWAAGRRPALSPCSVILLRPPPLGDSLAGNITSSPRAPESHRGGTGGGFLPGAVIDFAARLLPTIAPALTRRIRSGGTAVTWACATRRRRGRR